VPDKTGTDLVYEYKAVVGGMMYRPTTMAQIIDNYLCAIRADRDAWREKAERCYGQTLHDLRSERDACLKELDHERARITELEAAQAKQIVTIENLIAERETDANPLARAAVEGTG
jgi:hypothetical protein